MRKWARSSDSRGESSGSSGGSGVAATMNGTIQHAAGNARGFGGRDARCRHKRGHWFTLGRVCGGRLGCEWGLKLGAGLVRCYAEGAVAPLPHEKEGRRGVSIPPRLAAPKESG